MGAEISFAPVFTDRVERDLALFVTRDRAGGEILGQNLLPFVVGAEGGCTFVDAYVHESG
jgi:hypothetical protein